MSKFVDEFRKLAEKAGISPDDVSKVSEVLGRDEFNNKFIPVQQFSQGLDKVRQEARVATAAEAREFYSRWAVDTLAAIGYTLDENGKAVPLAKSDESPVGTPSPAAKEPVTSGNYVDRETFERAMANHSSAVEALFSDGMEIVSDYQDRFRRKFPMGDFKKFLSEHQDVPLRVAYQYFIAPEVRKSEEEATKVREQKLREEIERDVRSKFNLPTDATPRDMSPFRAGLAAQRQVEEAKSKPADPPAGTSAALRDQAKAAFIQKLEGGTPPA